MWRKVVFLLTLNHLVIKEHLSLKYENNELKSMVDSVMDYVDTSQMDKFISSKEEKYFIDTYSTTMRQRIKLSRVCSSDNYTLSKKVHIKYINKEHIKKCYNYRET